MAQLDVVCAVLYKAVYSLKDVIIMVRHGE